MLTCILTPGDNLYKLNDRELKVLAEYLDAVNFNQTFCNQLSNFKVASILTDRLKLKSNEAVKVMIKDIDKKLRSRNDSRLKNLFVGFFHTMFGGV